MVDTVFILFTTIACLVITGRAVMLDARLPWFTAEETATGSDEPGRPVGRSYGLGQGWRARAKAFRSSSARASR